MVECKPIPTPMNVNEKLSKDDGKEKANPALYKKLVSSLIYLTNTRLDIVYIVSITSRFMNDLSKHHHATTKRILWYFKGTKTYSILYQVKEDSKLTSYIDRDWASLINDKKVLHVTYSS